MATQTNNIGLTLPTGSENVSRQIVNENNTKIDTAIGDLSSLDTTEKTNLVGAVNELNGNLGFLWNGTSYKYPLQIRVVSGTCANQGVVKPTFDAFPHAVLGGFAVCSQSSFNAPSNILVNALTNGEVTLYQANSAGVNMVVSAIIFGY